MHVSKASIFKRMSDVPEMQLSAATDYTAAYKVRTTFFTRHEDPVLITPIHPAIYRLPQDAHALASRTHIRYRRRVYPREPSVSFLLPNQSLTFTLLVVIDHACCQ